MKLRLAIIAALVAPSLTFADSNEIVLMKKSNQVLETQADTCVLFARTAYLRLGAGLNNDELERRLKNCIVDGKSATKNYYAEVKAAFDQRAVPPELADWRVEWMSAFDATAMKPGEIQSQYMRRSQEARTRVERATHKFEIATE